MLLIWMIALPFLSGFILGLCYLYKPEMNHAAIPVLATVVSLISFIIAAILSVSVLGSTQPIQYLLGNWMVAGEYVFRAVLYADSLSAIIFLVVTSICFLTHVYSLGYMKKDTRWVKFYAYINFLCGTMLLAVAGGSLPLLFVGWQGVTLFSFLLIGFWYQDLHNELAARKTFIIHRIGDAAFLVAMALALRTFGTLEFATISPLQTEGANHAAYYPVMQLEIIAFLLFIACMSRCALFPLHVWLQGVLKSPIPSVVMIYGATSMVMGVYLIARCAHIFNTVSVVNEFMVIIGVFTSLAASILALFHSNIKKVIAYFSLSQVGLVVSTLGLGAYAAAIFCIVMHAMIASLLFMGAGSVMYGMSAEQDVKKMGGLKTRMVATTITFMIGYLAAIGFPFLSGFAGKGYVLFAFSQSGYFWYGILAVVALVVTVIHMTRLLALTFLGSDTRVPLEEAQKIRESPNTMLWPLWILAVISIFLGWSFVSLQEVLESIFPQAYLSKETWSLQQIKIFISLGVITLCFVSLRFYSKVKDKEGAEIGLSRPMQKCFLVVDRTLLTLGEFFVSLMSSLFQAVEWGIKVGVIKSLRFVLMSISRGISAMATGIVQNYMFFILLGVLFIIYFAVGM